MEGIIINNFSQLIRERMEKILTAEEQKKLQFDILCEVDEFCRNNDYRYSLAFGTLLGAVRHNGFIPWDDDVDIIMPLPDMLLFKNNFRSSKLKYCDIDTERYYCNPFSNICHTDTYRKEGLLSRRYYGLGLDLYPVVGFPSSLEEGNMFFKKLNELQAQRNRLIRLRRRVMKVCPLKTIPLFSKVIREYSDLMLYSYPYNQSKSFFISGPLSWDFVFDYDLFADLIEVNFEGHKFLATAKYDEWLSKRYGDYMSMPPIEQRVPHHGQTYYWNR